MTITKPIFVFGCCNSGTTILWEALKKHPGLSGPEVEDQDLEGMPRSMRHWLGRDTFRLWAHPRFGLCYYSTEQDCNSSDERVLREIYQRNLLHGTRLIVKSPAHTLRVRLIQGYFPDADFIAIVRNGYAVSEGIIRKRMNDPERPQFRGLTTTIEEAAEQWFRSNVVVVSHHRFLRNYLIVRYEDLVSNTEAIMRQVLDFCHLDNASFPVPVFDISKNAEQIGRLTNEEVHIITRVAGPMLHHFGYA